MTDVIDSAALDRLQSYVDRLMNLREERSNISADISAVLKEAECDGFAKVVLTALCQRIEKDAEKLANGDALLALYEDALDCSPPARLGRQRDEAPVDDPPPKKETARDKRLREAKAWAGTASTARH